MTLLVAGLAVSTFAFALGVFLIEGEADGDVFLPTRDFFSIDTVISPGF
jgi:hypothetical protein